MREKFEVGQLVKPRGNRKSSQNNYFKNYATPYTIKEIISFSDAVYKELVLTTPRGTEFTLWDDSVTALVEKEKYSLTF